MPRALRIRIPSAYAERKAVLLSGGIFF